ncbi:chromatin assembly factor 1 subunit FSM [Oryza glaberrima]|uniref:chromatin assembly factor 1 subunit FSM n=1 Tax=Oryza glaberrima TaxID=4538 RepID=UPI00023DEC3C|nr:chromatin assembly factor 1 subunit FSM [Oryza glaberrima]XP_052166624.1 chromatin assembly factor 1 subunit FSM [Oryza glaberrima]
MEGGKLLGVAHPEPANSIDAELRYDLGQSRMQVDGPVVLNRSAELEPSDSMAIDDVPVEASSQPAPAKQSPALMDTIVEVQKQLKRKRASSGPALAAADKDALVSGCCQELEGLLEYYREVAGHRMQFEVGNLSTNAAIGCLLEESSLGLSKLVDEIYEKLKGMEGVSATSVRSSVLLIGQRMMYGQSSPDADVLEDESETALWCWEVRDLKVIPLRMRGPLSTRRTARKKIHERITAIYSTLSVLEAPGAEAQVNDMRKASLKLSKALNLEGIKSLVERATQKSNIERGAKNTGSTAKEPMQEMVKSNNDTGIIENVDDSQLQKNTSTNEKDTQKAQKQVEKELKQKEKEEARMRKQQKKQQEEALREQKRREKEEAEMKKQQRKQEEEAQKEQKRREKEEAETRKQQKKQQEEAEKEQKRREKEAVQLKKQLAIQKQASMMERFFKNKKDSEKLEKSGGKDSGVQTTDPCTTNKEVVPLVTSIIDSSFSQKENWALEDLRRLQISGWQKLSSYNRSSRWGIRNKPKKEAFKELKLQKTSDNMLEEILSPNEDTCHNLSQENEPDKSANDVDMLPAVELQFHGTNHANPLPTRSIKRKLLQFDKSNRPAYYGTWRKKSAVVGPRCPLKMDPDLDYEVDSDDEWEEEDPGESLSDCEKDNDEVMEEDSKITDEESEDSFFVPDGYLSDNEGIQIESLLDDKDEASSSPPDQCAEVEEFRALLRQQKVLNTLTEQALRKSQPLVISNLTHEKADLLTAGDLKGTSKIEQLCLQVLSMRICPGGATIDLPVIDSSSANAEETNQLNVKSSPAAASAIPDTDLAEIVKVIGSCRDGINKLVESLHQKFPNVSKSQLKNKVREISEFVDNRWQVKKEVLSKLGLSSSPASSKKPKSIATYFSKRCLPPEEAILASPELRLKSKTTQNVNGDTDIPRISLLPSSQ